MNAPVNIDSVATQGDKLRLAIRYIDNAKKLIPNTLLVKTADESLDLIWDDIDTVTQKLKKALAAIDALIDEMDQD